MKYIIYIISLTFIFFQTAFSQKISDRNELLGGLRLERTCFDINHYDLHVQLNIQDKSIQGKNSIRFTTTHTSQKIQLDLYAQLSIDSIIFENHHCAYERKFDSFFIQIPRQLQVGQVDEITVYYHGKVVIAPNAPWDGGFVFSKDSSGNPFIGVACQEIGACSWWPTKELYSDKCDSADIYIGVPESLQAISNGKLLDVKKENNLHVYHWKVTHPINNYDISVTIGQFKHFSDRYHYQGQQFDLDYYVLPENYKRATVQFKQVKPMLKIYQRLFGVYPFSNDSYKLIEAPYLGMEHQSGIAYGNHYLNGYLGRYFAPISKKFDFIIIHESGHEYWGNSVTMSDLSDMWIHEGFCTYTELLYVEQLFGKKYTNDYAQYWRTMVKNQEPIVNERYSHQEPSADIYYKGALLIQSLRFLLDDDKLFMDCLKALQEKFKYQSVSTQEIIRFINQFTKRDLTVFFEQYLYRSNPPVLSFRLIPNPDGKGYIFKYKWDSVISGFSMPVILRYNSKKIKVNVTDEWSEVNLKVKSVKDYHIDETKSYFITAYE